jgi:hypothetical protein
MYAVREALKGSMAGPRTEEATMKLVSKADLYKKSDRALAGLKEEIRKGIGNCEQDRRRGYAAQQNIRTVQGQRRLLRPNL